MCFAESLFLCQWEEEKLIKSKDVYKGRFEAGGGMWSRSSFVTNFGRKHRHDSLHQDFTVC